MKRLLIAFIIIGTIGLSINAIFGMNTVSYLTKTQITDGIYAYKFNVFGYITNIKDSFTDVAVMTLELPTRAWITDIQNFADFGNNMAVILDYIIFVINILLYPLKIGGYLLKNVLSFLGIDTISQNNAGGLQWLVNFAKGLQIIAIPYI